MSINNNPNDFLNMPAFDALRWNGYIKMVIKAMSICPSYMQIIRTSRRISILTI